MENKQKQSYFAELSDYTCVFFGMGRIAQDFYEKYCREKALLSKPTFWCDNNKEKQGTRLYGIEVISPEMLFAMSDEYFRSGRKLAVIITATGINLLQIVCQLEQAALKAHLYSAFQLDAICYFQENNEKVNVISHMFADEKSRQIYMCMIDNMQKGRCIDFSLLDENQYFDNDVIPRLEDGEIIVDAGVCNGEEIDKAFHMNANIQIYAFEPDEQSMRKLKEKYQDNKNIILCEYALWNENRKIYFANNAEAPSASRVAALRFAEEENGISAAPLDELIKEKVTLIKMDIEGAEYKALQGAAKTIQTYKPKLAICVYHNIEDYVRIPLLIQ